MSAVKKRVNDTPELGYLELRKLADTSPVYKKKLMEYMIQLYLVQVEQIRRMEMEKWQHYQKQRVSQTEQKFFQRKVGELEIRFQGVHGSHVTKHEFDRVSRVLHDMGFYSGLVPGHHVLWHLMRIQVERDSTGYNNTSHHRNNNKILSNIRVEIDGETNIREYCASNQLANIPREAVKYVQKMPANIDYADNHSPNLYRLDFDDMNFRVSYNYETMLGANHDGVKEMTQPDKWARQKKVFRYLSRMRYRHKTLPFFVDMSIVRMSPTVGKGIMQPFYTVEEAELNTAPEQYEIEIELDNSRFVSMDSSLEKERQELMTSLRKMVRIITGAIQGSNYPITNAENDQVIREYLHLVRDTAMVPFDAETHTIYPRDFIGPSSLTLQLENVVDPRIYDRVDDDEIDVPITAPNITTDPCILYDYTATEKADGERKMLFVGKNRKIYTIDTNMRAQYTGSKSEAAEEDIPCLLDGEYIVRDIHDRSIRLFAAFDVYYWGGANARANAFHLTTEEMEQLENDGSNKK
jgi:hypothetical protein